MNHIERAWKWARYRTTPERWTTCVDTPRLFFTAFFELHHGGNWDLGGYSYVVLPQPTGARRREPSVTAREENPVDKGVR